MGLTDTDFNEFFIFLLKTALLILFLRFVLFVIGFDLSVPYLDPLIFSIYGWIGEFLHGFSMAPINTHL